jgi:YebC/PmpR family DNA-binding regulatory protein
MSGHSKWHSIKHKKGALDAKRGKLFTKVIRELTIAARLGGGDPDTNPRLRTAVQAAKAANMPADNIKRAIQKGTGELPGASYEELILEGYGPGGVAVLVEGSTDNRNRSISEIRHVFTRHGGNLGTAGCVSYLFSPRGVVSLKKDAVSEDDLMALVLDAGAEDLQAIGDFWEVYARPENHEAVVEAVKKAGLEPERAAVEKHPENTVPLEGPKAQQFLKMLEALDDHDDVQNVWANFDISDEELEAATAGR